MIALLWVALLGDPAISAVETPDQVAQWVASDLVTVPVEDQPFQRYLWVPSWADVKWHHASTYAVNLAVSRSGVIQQPTYIANGWIQRWDLRQLVQTDVQLKNITAVWDGLGSQEPYFPIAGVSVSSFKKLAQFETVVGVQYPVYRTDWFVSKALSSIDGGKYLEFRGFSNLKSDDGRTPEEIALARFGVFEQAAKDVDGDRRVGMFQSQVTGKARSVIALNGLVGFAWITEDLFDEDTEAINHPIYNLLENQVRGHEIIIELPNGLHAFLITDDKGNVLDEAPPNLVADHRIPAPHTKRLQGGAISCIRCHASGQGLRDCANDVQKLLAGPLAVLGDLNDKTGFAYDEIATRYAGRKFERSLVLGRLNYQDAVDDVTNGTMTVEEIAELVSSMYAGMRYELVTAEVALKELGFKLVDDEEKPVNPSAIMAQLVEVNPTLTEDPSIAALFAGIPIRRTDFERVYGELLIRSIEWRKER